MKLDFDYTKYPRPMKKHRDAFIYGLMDDLFEAGMNSVRARAVAGSVCELMSNQDLHYHNYIHPLAMFSFAQHNSIKLELWQKLAIWFHDVIYVPFKDDNENKSYQTFLSIVDIDIKTTEMVVDQIGYTKEFLRTSEYLLNSPRFRGPRSCSTFFTVMDLDLCSLVFPYEGFKKVQELVQKELNTTPQQTIGFFKAILKRAPIFRSEEFSKFEEAAQTNIQTYIKEFGDVV